MNELSPRARALIESAIEHEEMPGPADLRRVRRAIVSGVAAGAVASAVSTTSFFAKAAAITGGMAGQVTACAVAGAIAAGATLAVHERFAEAPPPPRAHVVVAAPAKRETVGRIALPVPSSELPVAPAIEPADEPGSAAAPTVDPSNPRMSRLPTSRSHAIRIRRQRPRRLAHPLRRRRWPRLCPPRR
jgi:hypothetical protein